MHPNIQLINEYFYLDFFIMELYHFLKNSHLYRPSNTSSKFKAELFSKQGILINFQKVYIVSFSILKHYVFYDCRTKQTF